MKKIPCEECISRAICNSRENVYCDDLFKVVFESWSDKDTTTIKSEYVAAFLPNFQTIYPRNKILSAVGMSRK